MINYLLTVYGASSIECALGDIEFAYETVCSHIGSIDKRVVDILNVMKTTFQIVSLQEVKIA